MKVWWLPAVAVFVFCAGTVAWTRPKLFRIESIAKEKTNVYSLPPPNVLATMTMGYRTATADYLWAHVLVTSGLRMGEKRPFSEVAEYLDAINYLDPHFREPYRLADTLLTFQINDTQRKASASAAMRILERGVTEFPYDAELHVNYGQFLAYIAPAFYEDGSEERMQVRRQGALVLMRAGELGDDQIIKKTISAATMLNKMGEIDAAISFLERLYSIADNDEVRQDIVHNLAKLRQGKQASINYESSREHDLLWRKDLPFAPRSWLSLLGTPREIWKCTGPSHQQDLSACGKERQTP